MCPAATRDLKVYDRGKHTENRPYESEARWRAPNPRVYQQKGGFYALPGSSVGAKVARTLIDHGLVLDA